MLLSVAIEAIDGAHLADHKAIRSQEITKTLKLS
jgi:hypothetical protein